MLRFDTNVAHAREQAVSRMELIQRQFECSTLKARLQVTHEFIETYVTATGERPQPYVLVGLANLLMLDYMTDQYKHAKSHQDGPQFQTNRQMRRRSRREVLYDPSILDTSFDGGA